jgi:two-component system NtrC family sensor kinase
MVEQAPMVFQLIRQLGLDVASVVAPTPEILRQAEGKSYGVFYVPEAKGSPYIPAQSSFVIPERIESVVGFGGLLRNGDMVAIILFSRIPVSEQTANRFRTIALDVRAALFGAGNLPTFEDSLE